MKTISDKKVVKNSFTIKKSRFVTHMANISSAEELKAFLNEYSQRNARHNCYGYKFGLLNPIGGFEDDKEPKNSAGKAIFNVIEKNQLNNVCILVTRHFGGIKLGIGPLTRAYTSSASEIIKKSLIKEIRLVWKTDIVFFLPNIKQINIFLNQKNIKIVSQQYTGNLCNYNLDCEDSALEPIWKLIKVVGTNSYYKIIE